MIVVWTDTVPSAPWMQLVQGFPKNWENVTAMIPCILILVRITNYPVFTEFPFWKSHFLHLLKYCVSCCNPFCKHLKTTSSCTVSHKVYEKNRLVFKQTMKVDHIIISTTRLTIKEW